jgi:hypothetical protein
VTMEGETKLQRKVRKGGGDTRLETVDEEADYVGALAVGGGGAGVEREGCVEERRKGVRALLEWPPHLHLRMREQ